MAVSLLALWSFRVVKNEECNVTRLDGPDNTSVKKTAFKKVHCVSQSIVAIFYTPNVIFIGSASHPEQVL